MRLARWWQAAGIACCIALASSCTSPRVEAPPSIPAVTVPEGFPEASYRNLSHPVLRIDMRQSLVTILVRRGGPFARLGHDHVVASRDVHGYADPQAGQTDLYLPLERLTVDEPALRAQARLDTQPTPEDIAGTRRNMLDKVLEAGRYPYALIHAEFAVPDRTALRMTITLHGTARAFDVPVMVEQHGNGMIVSGKLAIRQTDFGIVPMSVLGGAILVQDEVELQFRIVAV